MTSVPKPLKFLREHYPALKQVYEKIKDPETKKFCADVVSVLAMGVSGSPVSKLIRKRFFEICIQTKQRKLINDFANFSGCCRKA